MSLFTDESAHPVPLATALTQKYGPDWMEWEYIVLRVTLDRDGINISRANLAKAMAAASVMTRDEFWQYRETFHFLCQALSGHVPTAETQQEHTVGDMMVAVDTATQLRKHLKELSFLPPFSEEVARYVAQQALTQGVWYLPEPLAFANKFTVQHSYRCRDCGNVAEIAFDDGLCDVCVDRYSMEQMGAWRANPDLVLAGRGKNIELFDKNPSGAIEKRLNELMSKKGLPLKETQTDICVSKILLALAQLNAAHEKMQEKVA